MSQPHHVWHVVNLLQLAAALREELEDGLRDGAAISLAEHDVLMSLLHSDGRLPMKDLAEIVMFSQSGITRIVDRLEGKGHVAREFSSEDRRICYAVLTENGRALLHEKAMPRVERIVADRFTRCVTHQDASELRRIVLDLLRANGWWDARRRTQGPLQTAPPRARTRPARSLRAKTRLERNTP